MTRRTDISSEMLWSYVEGKLEARTSDAIARYLDRHPEMLREVRVMRKQQDLLDMVEASVLHEPVPGRLRAVIERARRRLLENDKTADSDDNDRTQ